MGFSIRDVGILATVASVFRPLKDEGEVNVKASRTLSRRIPTAIPMFLVPVLGLD